MKTIGEIIKQGESETVEFGCFLRAETRGRKSEVEKLLVVSCKLWDVEC
jgi:hypothetical protein